MRTLKWLKWRTADHSGVRLAESKSLLIIELWQQEHHVKSVRTLPDLKKTKSVYLRACWRWFHGWHQLVASGFDHHAALHSLLMHGTTQQECQLSHSCIQQVEQGRPLSQGLLRSFLAKDTHVIRQIQFAEQSGSLEAVLKDIADDFEHQLYSYQQLKKSMAYPVMVLILGVMLILGLKFFIFPRFANLYAQTGAELPGLTRVILNPSDFYTLQDLAVITLIASSLYLLLNGALRLWKNSFYLKSKIWQLSNALSPMFLKATAIELGLMLKGLEQNMPIQDICRTLSTHSKCTLRTYLWLTALQFVHRGQPIERIFQLLRLPERFTAMITIGTQSGRLTQQLRLVVHQLESTQQQRQQHLLQVIPHIMLSIMSLITAGLMAALYLPLFQLGQTVG
ncbi:MULTISPECIES: type II secretion system F family protein [Gammaproteobacteria]|uniref:type II secretion system F family protein n=1 Tax=Gammaproteobacteria TaxID=1236 RepID=UPI000DCF6E3E|nr:MULTISPECIES: type II secretion system F family protein [Gammaproteobacteria]RTE86307.1 hypothetical protein DQX04_06975 [Aliidiomarina sp. B3213]TCZ91657.1 hypothetical protein EYQ95_06985 [Lysobacter sp. N42]